MCQQCSVAAYNPFKEACLRKTDKSSDSPSHFGYSSAYVRRIPCGTAKVTLREGTGLTNLDDLRESHLPAKRGIKL